MKNKFTPLELIVVLFLIALGLLKKCLTPAKSKA
jgi:hypothetical protein